MRTHHSSAQGGARRLPVAAAIVAVLALLAVGCSPGTDDAAAAQGPVQTSDVAVRDDFFEPEAVEVPAGAEVTWTWEGDNDHNVVGDDFSSDVQSDGTFSQTFDEPGTYAYRCTLHANMDGTVVVTDDAAEDAS